MGRKSNQVGLTPSSCGHMNRRYLFSSLLLFLSGITHAHAELVCACTIKVSDEFEIVTSDRLSVQRER